MTHPARLLLFLLLAAAGMVGCADDDGDLTVGTAGPVTIESQDSTDPDPDPTASEADGVESIVVTGSTDSDGSSTSSRGESGQTTADGSTTGTASTAAPAATGSSTTVTATASTTASGPTTTSTTTSVTTPATTSTTAAPARNGVLIFSRTQGFRHPSIGDGVAAMSAIADGQGFEVVTSEDGSIFTDAELARFAAVVFLSTSGNVLNGAQQAAFERYIAAGGGFVGVHAASDTEYGWPWYGGLVGAYFSDHPLVPNDEFVDCHCFTADVKVVTSDGSTSHLPAVWTRRDEWYNFRSPPSGVTVLLSVDESTYPGGTMGSPHAISWSHRYAGGRSWYTAMGHTPQSFQDPDFRRHLQGGLRWAAGLG